MRLYDGIRVLALTGTIAAMLDRLDDPNPAAIAMLHDLLADGCGSPLYNPDIHVSELLAALHYARRCEELGRPVA